MLLTIAKEAKPHPDPTWLQLEISLDRPEIRPSQTCPQAPRVEVPYGDGSRSAVLHFFLMAHPGPKAILRGVLQ